MRIARWDQVLSSEGTNECIKELALWFASRISEKQLRESLTTFISGDNYSALCDFSVDYNAVSPPDAYALRQTLAFYSKRVDLDLGIDKEAAALATFKESERLCAETNSIFRKWGSGSFQFDPDVERVIFTAQRKIASLLGDVPSLDTIKGRFGPGATTTVVKRTASARRKLGERFACSEEFLGTLVSALEELPAWIPFTEDSDTAVVSVDIHPGLLRFVPKNAKTYRGIVVEPMLNSFFQIGIGDFIADKLRARGIDIRDQTRNQTLAQIGSVTGALATLDLSSASDTISIELIAHLLPVDWYLFLSMFRTGTIIYEGEPMKLQKFSSMGNGFTFPLETLIFWALAVSCTAEAQQATVSVFGDDIIVPVESYELLDRTLCATGFLLNKKKSFASGPFRESCGKDYLSGIDIRPVFLKDRLSGESAFTLHNFFVRRGELDAAKIVLSWLEPFLQIWGPDKYGDGHLIGDHDLVPCRHSLSEDPRISSGWSGYTFETFSWRGRKDFRPYPGDYVFPAYSIYVGAEFSPLDDQIFSIVAKDRRLANAIWGETQIKLSFGKLKSLSSGCLTYDSNGLLGTSTPGKRGYKRIKIYTLTPP